MSAPDGYVRVACANENCGTFLLDEALHEKLKRTGESFHCPEGHSQYFTESTEQELRDRVDKLEQELERWKERSDKFREGQKKAIQEKWDEQKRRKELEKLLFDRVDGVIEVYEDEWMWSCSCGSRCRKRFASEQEAEQAYREHRRRDAHTRADEEVST